MDRDARIVNALRNLTEVVREVAKQVKTEDDEYVWSLLQGVDLELKSLREEVGGLTPDNPDETPF